MLISIPVSLLLIKQQQDTRQRASGLNPDRTKYIILNKADGNITQETINEIKNKIEISNSGNTKLGIGLIISYLEKSDEQENDLINNLTSLSINNDIPILIKLDGISWWETRSDLWNWWDPSKEGYNPDNKYNVEWTSWNPDDAIKISWRNWGQQSRVKPHPNLASPKYIEEKQKDLRRILPIIQNWYDNLPPDKKYLFAGLVLDNELSIGLNHYYYPNGNSYVDPACEENSTCQDVANQRLCRWKASFGDPVCCNGDFECPQNQYCDIEDNSPTRPCSTRYYCASRNSTDSTPSASPIPTAPPGQTRVGGSCESNNPDNDPTTGLNFYLGTSGGLIQLGYAAVKTYGIKDSGDITINDLDEVIKKHAQMLAQTVQDTEFPQNSVFIHGGGNIQLNPTATFSYSNVVTNIVNPSWSFYDMAHNPADATGLSQALDQNTTKTWAAVEWLYTGGGKEGWKSAVNNTLNYRNNKLVAIYNWEGINNNTGAIDAINEILTESITTPPTPSPTPEAPTPTASPSATPTLTPTPTTIPTPTPSVPTPIPTNTPFPTPTPQPGNILIGLSLKLTGISNIEGNNNTPVNFQRTDAMLKIYNTNGQEVKEANGILIYNQETGLYEGKISIDSLEINQYFLKIKLDNTLFQILKNGQKQTVILTITEGQIEYALGQVNLISGDINNDNKIDLLDYNIIINCTKKLCSDEEKQQADLNDDGKIDMIDYNILLRNFSSIEGD